MAGPLTPVVDARLTHGPQFNAKGQISGRRLVPRTVGRGLAEVPRTRWAATRFGEVRPLRRLRACRADWVALNHRLAGAGVLAQCHRAGLKTMIWTVDEDAGIRRWLNDPRVTVLITNRHADAVALRAALAPPRPGTGPRPAAVRGA